MINTANAKNLINLDQRFWRWQHERACWGTGT